MRGRPRFGITDFAHGRCSASGPQEDTDSPGPVGYHIGVVYIQGELIRGGGGILSPRDIFTNPLNTEFVARIPKEYYINRRISGEERKTVLSVIVFDNIYTLDRPR